MKRIVVILTALATVAGCGMDGNAKAALTLNKNDNTSYAVDPGTALAVAANGLSAAASLKQLFGGTNPAETSRRLAAIQQQNTQMMAMLVQALSMLEQLGVTVGREVREQGTREIDTHLRADLQLFYENWQTELRNPSAARESERAYRGLLPDIRTVSRRLADTETYGFGFFQTVGHGMLTETWLSGRLRESRQRRQEAAQTYMRYFERVLDTNVQGSVGSQLKANRDQAARMKAVLDAADASLTQQRSWVSDSRVSEGRCTTAYRTTTAISGDQRSGYEVSQNRVQIGRRNCEPADVRSDRGGGRAGLILLLWGPDPVDNGDSSPGGRVSYWNEVRRIHQVATANAEILTKTADTARSYLEAARAIASGM
jgi:hypothetical protein